MSNSDRRVYRVEVAILFEIPVAAESAEAAVAWANANTDEWQNCGDGGLLRAMQAREIARPEDSQFLPEELCWNDDEDATVGQFVLASERGIIEPTDHKSPEWDKWLSTVNDYSEEFLKRMQKPARVCDE